MTSAVHLHLWGRTEVGRVRRENQDAFLVAALAPEAGRGARFAGEPDFRTWQPPGETADRVDAENEGSVRIDVRDFGVVLLVADGMGGAAGGAVASHIAADTISEVFGAGWRAASSRTPESCTRVLAEAMAEANDRIRRRAGEQPHLRGMGTTATVAVVFDSAACLAQVGDSRAYLIRDRRAHQLTRDQSMVQELVEKGAMTPEEAKWSVHRHVLLQALGTEPTVEVGLKVQDLRSGDVLLLCTDGLTGVVSDPEIAAAVHSAPTLSAACDALVSLANERGGPDNVTVLLARVGDASGDPT